MHRFLSAVLALVLCLMPVLSSAELAGTVSSDYEPLYQFAEPYGFKLGGAFGYWDMRNTAFMGFLNDHFNSLTCTNETKAYMQAVKMLRADTPAVKQFIETGKTRIIEWYNTQIDFLISEANALAGQDKYDEAIALLFTVPTVCKDAFDKAMRAAEQIFQQKIDIEGAQLLNMATHVWNANQHWSGANEAAGYLSQIHPLSSAVPGAMALSENIAKRVKELDNREWNFEMKKFDAHVSLESQRISAMAEVGKAMAKRPVNYYNMNSFGWW